MDQVLFDDLVQSLKEAKAIARGEAPRYLAADLNAQCDKNALPPADLAAWDAVAPVGSEFGA